jgi:hypothetical protein
MPRTEPLPDLSSGPQATTDLPLDDTRTRGRPGRPTPSFQSTESGWSESVTQLRPRSRAPLILAGLVVAAGIGVGTWWVTKPGPQPPRRLDLHERAEMPPPPPPPSTHETETPQPPPPKVVTPPPKAQPEVTAQPENAADNGEAAAEEHATRPARARHHHPPKTAGKPAKATPVESGAGNNTTAPILP